MGSEILRGKPQGGGPGIDRAEAERAIRLLCDPEQQVELRPLPSARSVILPGSDVAGLVNGADLAEQDGNTVYLVLNPVNPPLGVRYCKDAHVQRRHWLFFDLDPIKAAGHEKECATQEEKAAAGELAATLSAWLAEQGFPLPVQIDSGNGYYLDYLVDLPNDDHAKALVRRLIKKLKERFDTAAAVIDGTVTNAARLAKLPGTLNRKGANTDERPHRRCRIIRVPDPLEAVPVEAIQAIAGTAAAEASGETRSPFQGRAWSGSKEAYGRQALAQEAGRVFLAIPGPREGRNNALFKATAALYELVEGGVLGASEVDAALRAAAGAAGLDEREIATTLASGERAGRQHPRGVPERNGTHAGTNGVPPKAESQAPDVPVTYQASTVKPRKVEWLWPGWVPLGKLTTFAGIMGIGKTFLLCDVAARVTQGGPWPDRAEQFTPGDVLFISGEDEADDTLVPRMIECGADLERIRFLTMEAMGGFTLASLKTLDRAAAECRGGLRLVIIDPPTSYLGDVDDHKNAELRSLLTPLQRWSSEQRSSVIFNTHLNKGGGQKIEAIFRVIGGIAWMAAVRAGHVVALDQDDDTKRLLVPLKMNLGPKPKPLAYTLDLSGDEMAKVKWLGNVEMTADQAVNHTEKKKRSVVASEWLAGLFSGKSELPSKTIFKAKSNQTTLSDDALREAKEDMGIRAQQRHDPEPGGSRSWWWYWPDQVRRTWEASVRAANAKAGDTPSPESEGEVE